MRDLLAAVAIGVLLLLLIGSANLALLHAVRAQARERELAVRAALGASRRRVMGQIALEHAILATGAFLVAWWLAAALTSVILPLAEAYIGRLVPGATASAPLGGRLVAWMALAAMIATVGLGMLPYARRPAPLVAALTGHAGAGDTPRRGRGRHLLVGLQVAATMALLAGAGLMLRTAWHLERIDVGFDPHGVLTASLALAEPRYPDAEARRAAIARLVEDAGALPRVEAAGLMSGNAFGSRTTRRVAADGLAPGAASPSAAIVAVTPSYFQTVRLPIVEGRPLSARDTAAREPVAVISRSLAAQLWPDGSSIGRLVTSEAIGAGAAALAPGETVIRDGVETAAAATYRVVGVAADVRRSLRRDSVPELYVSLAQAPMPYLTLLIRAQSAGDPGALLGPVARAVLAIDPELPLIGAQSLEDEVAGAGVRPRFLATLLGSFAVLAAAVALIGVYAISAWVARQRRREAAVRIALGAQPRDVIRLLTMTGARAVLAGLAVGWIASLALGRLLASELSGVDPRDVRTRAAVALVLFVTCVLAVYSPARAVATSDPASALRE